MTVVNRTNEAMLRGRTAMFAAAMLILLFFIGASGAHAQDDAANSLPKLTGAQEKSLDKNARNAWKKCGGDLKHKGEVAQACLNVAGPLHAAGNDPAARTVLQRSCSLGNTGGCNELGKALFSDGDTAAARMVWTAGPCANGNLCKVSLFDSYADEQPLDLAKADEYGLPLCDQGHDDRVCARMRELGSHADFAAIQEHHKQEQIDALNKQINNSILAIPLLRAQVSLCQTQANNATGFAALLAQGQLKLAEAELNGALKQDAANKAQLEQLTASR
jgi:hypothetical protein